MLNGETTPARKGARGRSSPGADELPPRPTLSADTFGTIRSWIIQGRLAADSVISERQIADALNLSRTPVREALGRLVGEGLLRRDGRTVMVNAIRFEDVLEILSVRRALEGEAVLLATARMGTAKVLELREAEEALLRENVVTPEAHWRVESAFHGAIAEASGNRLLIRMIAELRERTRLYGYGRIPQRLEPGRREHLEILEAMLAGNAKLAQRRMQAHLQKVTDAILGTLGRVA